MSSAPFAYRESAFAAQHARLTSLVFVGMLVCAIGVAALWPTAHSLATEWVNTSHLTYTHGYLIAAISAGLLVHAARRRAGVPEPDARIALAIPLVGLVWLVCLRAGIQTGHQLLFPLLLFLTVAAAVGARHARALWFPFAYLYLAVPFWGAGNALLQGVSTHAVKALLALTSVPAFVEGNFVHIPEGSFEIAGGCSGLHFFLVAIALAALMGEIHRDTWQMRLRALLLAAAVAMICNWLRIYAIVIAGHLTDMQHYLVRVDHYRFGWVVFAVGMGLFFWWSSRWPARPRTGSFPAAPLAPTATPARILLGAGLALVALAVAPMLGALRPIRAANVDAGSVLPPLAGWQGPAPAATWWQPAFPGSDVSRLARYAASGRDGVAFVAAYGEQRQGKEVIGYDNSLFAGVEAGTSTRLAFAHGSANAMEVREGGSPPALLAYYYRIGSQVTPLGLSAQLRYALSTLVAPVESRLVAVLMRCEPDCDAAREGVRRWFDDYEMAIGEGP